MIDNKLSTLEELAAAFGACMSEKGGEATAKALAELILLSTQSAGKSFKHTTVIGTVSVTLDNSQETQCQGFVH